MTADPHTSSARPRQNNDGAAHGKGGAGKLRVLVGYERSGAVRRAFRALGHDAWSNDIEPADDGSPYHLQGDVWDFASGDWDLGIFHPVCTYLTISAAWAFTDGPYHQKVGAETLVGAARRAARADALANFRRLLALPYPKAIENPAPSFVSKAIRPPDQTIQPYHFGDDASKRTGLWLDRVPRLRPTRSVEPRMVDGRPRWANQTDSGQNKLSPSGDRASLRSVTYAGIASALAQQVGGYVASTVRRAA
jgi:hypothetical protein